MSTHQSQPPQPPKQSAYNQPTNPISQTPFEQRSRTKGDPVPAIYRGPNSQPSSSTTYNRQHQEPTNRPDVDMKYGVEQQPAEGDIAAAVKGKSARARERAQAGAHAGPVGSMRGPGHPEMADLDRKREEHDRVLGERVGQSPATPDEEGEELRRGKLERDEELDVEGAVREGTGAPVV